MQAETSLKTLRKSKHHVQQVVIIKSQFEKGDKPIAGERI
jgi:hypothetical protein